MSADEIPPKPSRDVERIYSDPQVVEAVHQLADALHSAQLSSRQLTVDHTPPPAQAQSGVDHEDNDERRAPEEGVGLHGVRRMLGYSKRDLLLFRRLHIMGLDRQLGDAVNAPELLADCEYLAHSGYLVEAPGNTSEVVSRFVDIMRNDRTPTNHRTKMRTETNRRYFDLSTYFASECCLAILNAAIRVLKDPFDLVDTPLPAGSELVLAAMLNLDGLRAFAVAPSLPKGGNEWEAFRTTFDSCNRCLQTEPAMAAVDLILSALPVPGDEVPLDAILDYVTDADTQRRLNRLNLWIRRMAQSGKDLEDIALDLDESLHDLAAHMALADMRAQVGTVRIALSIPLGVIEELIRLRPKRALDVVFEYRERKATRLEAELSAPGGAVAYVYQAERRFRSDDRLGA